MTLMVQDVPDLRGFSLADLMQLSPKLRRAGDGATSMEEAGTRIVRTLRDGFLDEEGGPQLELVRLYRTTRPQDLDDDLLAFASADGPLDPNTPVMTLLASAGSEEAWNDRKRSEGHRAIPLRSQRAEELSPMISRLFEQFGAEPLLTGDVRPLEKRSNFDVFHVGDPLESPFVPAKDFVRDYGIRSVVGFGAFLPPADMFAAILFSNVPIAADTATMFPALALSVKIALLQTAEYPMFTS